MVSPRLATAWALFQGLLIEALPFLLIGVLIASAARWLSPGGRWLRRLPTHPLLGPLAGGAEVAGTGTIAADGTVGPIGGIVQKMHGSAVSMRSPKRMLLIAIESAAV